jgi:CBS domain containing-hemolysin-like protein
MDRSEWVMLGLAVAAVVLAFLLVAAETAIGRVSRTRVEEMVRERPNRATERLRLVIEERARYVNVVLFLHTTFAVAATALVTYLCVEAGPWGPLAGLFIGLGIMTLVMYVALGVAPRTLGRQHADRIALRAAGFARGAAALLGPLVSLLILIGNALTPGRGYREGPFASQAELRELVDLAEADQVIDDDDAAMLHSVFELGDTIVREVMVPRTEMVWIERHKTLRQAISLALRSGYSRIPVIGDGPDDVVGVFYLKDVVNRVFEHRDAETAERIDSRMRPAVFVPDSKLVDDLLRDLQSQRVHIAIAVDEYGGTAGLVTIEDVLEEIVGEITDEYDTELPEVERLPSGGYRLSARMHVEDAAELLGFEIDADELGVDTISGLIAKRLGKVALPGASITEQGWALTAEQASGRRNRVTSVLAEHVGLPVHPGEASPAGPPAGIAGGAGSGANGSHGSHGSHGSNRGHAAADPHGTTASHGATAQHGSGAPPTRGRPGGAA